MRTKETGRKYIEFEYPHGSDEWLKSHVLKLCKRGPVRGGKLMLLYRDSDQQSGGRFYEASKHLSMSSSR